MNNLKTLLRNQQRLITKLERLANTNDSTVRVNEMNIKKMQEENLELIAEAQAARNIANNFRKLIKEEIE